MEKYVLKWEWIGALLNRMEEYLDEIKENPDDANYMYNLTAAEQIIARLKKAEVEGTAYEMSYGDACYITGYVMYPFRRVVNEQKAEEIKKKLKDMLKEMDGYCLKNR